MTPKNRNILIGVGIVALIVIFYMRTKKSEQAMATAKQPAKKPQVAPVKTVTGNATYNDAVDFLQALQNKGYIVRGISDEVRKDFTDEYQKDISKVNHLKVMEILKKPQDKWTLEEEFFYKDNFINNVLRLDNE